MAVALLTYLCSISVNYCCPPNSRLFINRDVRNNVEMLYRLIHCCNCILLSAWTPPPPTTEGESNEPEEKEEEKEEEEEVHNNKRQRWVSVYANVALEHLGEAVMAVMSKFEHANLDTRCVQLLQTIGTVGSDDVRAKLSVAGLPQLLTDEFMEGIETLVRVYTCVVVTVWWSWCFVCCLRSCFVCCCCGLYCIISFDLIP